MTQPPRVPSSCWMRDTTSGCQEVYSSATATLAKSSSCGLMSSAIALDMKAGSTSATMHLRRLENPLEMWGCILAEDVVKVGIERFQKTVILCKTCDQQLCLALDGTDSLSPF